MRWQSLNKYDLNGFINIRLILVLNLIIICLKSVWILAFLWHLGHHKVDLPNSAKCCQSWCCPFDLMSLCSKYKYDKFRAKIVFHSFGWIILNFELCRKRYRIRFIVKVVFAILKWSEYCFYGYSDEKSTYHSWMDFVIDLSKLKPKRWRTEIAVAAILLSEIPPKITTPPSIDNLGVATPFKIL